MSDDFDLRRQLRKAQSSTLSDVIEDAQNKEQNEEIGPDSNTADTTVQEDVDRPKWMESLQIPLTAKHPETNELLAPLAELLTQLPIVAATTSKSAKESYYTQVIQELSRVFYIRMRLILTSDELSKTEKQSRTASLSKQFKSTVLKIAHSLGEYTE